MTRNDFIINLHESYVNKLRLKFAALDYENDFSNFSQKIGFDISCKLSSKVTICMKNHSLFSGKNKKGQ